MSPHRVLQLVVEALKGAGVPYMLTGSLAGSYHGSPRATQDVDLVVDADLSRLLDLASRLNASGFYVSDVAVREAVDTRGMFNAIDPDTGWKVDFILRKERAFSRTEFGRRTTADFLGLELSIARPEDVIIAKLEWSRLGDSERQLDDAADILRVQGDQLSISEIERWVADLSLTTQWSLVLNRRLHT